VGHSVGLGDGSGQMSSSVAEQVRADALHSVAPQHEYVAPRQATHEEVSLRSAGPEQSSSSQSRDPVPA